MLTKQQTELIAAYDAALICLAAAELRLKDVRLWAQAADVAMIRRSVESTRALAESTFNTVATRIHGGRSDDHPND